MRNPIAASAHEYARNVARRNKGECPCRDGRITTPRDARIRCPYHGGPSLAAQKAAARKHARENQEACAEAVIDPDTGFPF